MKLLKTNLDALLQELNKEATVLVPKTIENQVKFAPLDAEGELAFDAVNSLMPPKDALFPQTEKMYKFKNDNGKLEINEIEEVTETVIFGIRPCDMYSITCMDDVFFTKTFVDSFYKRKREHVLTVAIGCTKVEETCFCDSFGHNPTDAPGADIMLNDLGDAYLVRANNEKGEAVLTKYASLFTEGEGEVPVVTCELKVEMDGVQPKLMKMFNHEIWKEVAHKCIGCGTCTYVCPTCYCFDIDNELNGAEGCKFRCWDSCMFSEYTRMAGGHNPRPSKTERVRNRFLHKLAFFEDRYGKTLCVGCGRCVSKCPVALDITTFIDKVGEVEL